MKKFILNFLPVLCLTFFIISCNKKDKTGLLIPKDAALVIHFNSSSFSSKLSWNDIKATNWFKKIYSENNDSLAEKILNDPASSGVDVKSDLVYFIKVNNNGSYFVIDGKLNDANSFESLCKKAISNGQIIKEGKFSSVNLLDKAAITWNNNWFACVVNIPKINLMGNFGKENSSGPQAKITADSLISYGKEILSLSDTKTLGVDDRFANLIREPGDIHLWLNMEQLYSSGVLSMYMSMMKVSSLFQGNIYASTFSFDNGKIVLKGKHYEGEEMTKLLKKYPAQPLDASLINRLPAENIMVAFADNFQPEGTNDLLKLTGLDGIINLMLAKANLSLDDIIKANKGQMLFALNGIETKKISDTSFIEGNKKPMIYTHEQPDIKFLFADAVNNNPSFDKLESLLKELLGKLNNEPTNITYQVKNNWLAIGNPENVNAFLSGNNNHVSFADQISGHPLGCFIDVKKILSLARNKVKDSSAMNILSASMNLWQNIVITGGDFKDGCVTSSTEINLVNKNTNSLRQLNDYLNQLSAAYSEHLAFKREQMDHFMMNPPKQEETK